MMPGFDAVPGFCCFCTPYRSSAIYYPPWNRVCVAYFGFLFDSSMIISRVRSFNCAYCCPRGFVDRSFSWFDRVCRQFCFHSRISFTHPVFYYSARILWCTKRLDSKPTSDVLRYLRFVVDFVLFLLVIIVVFVKSQVTFVRSQQLTFVIK